MLDVAGALSRRDGRATRDAATRLLGDSSHLPGPVADYLLRAAMLGAVMSKDYSDVAKIDDEFGRDVKPSDSTFVQRVYMRAFANAAPATRRAGDESKAQDP